MTKQDILVFEKLFEEMLRHLDNNSESYGVAVPADSKRWVGGLPESIEKLAEQNRANGFNFIAIHLKGWARKEFKVTDKGIHIKTAFGDYETSAFFTFDEIPIIFDENLEAIMQKPYEFGAVKRMKSEEGEYTLKKLMEQFERSQGAKKRMIVPVYIPWMDIVMEEILYMQDREEARTSKKSETKTDNGVKDVSSDHTEKYHREK